MGSRDYLLTDEISGQGTRVRYFSRQLITADDLTQDQNYHREKRRLHNRLLHGWGIVCGLDVKVNPTTETPLNLSICRGYALSCPGDEMYVSADISFDLAKCIAGSKALDCCSPVMTGHVDRGGPFYIAIKYSECLSHPVRVPPIGCGCDDTACEYSRIRDGFEIRCLADLPKSHEPEEANDPRNIPELCDAVGQKVVPCPSCDGDPWVVLAKITVPTSGPLTTVNVDRSNRRILLSSAILQKKAEESCPST